MSVGCKGRNINKLEREAQLYQALSKDYYSVYYIDFKKNIIEPIRMSKEIERDYGDFFRKNPSYEDAIFGYIENNVLEEEQADMKQVVSYETLKKQLKEQKKLYDCYGKVRTDFQDQSWKSRQIFNSDHIDRDYFLHKYFPDFVLCIRNIPS